MFSGNTRTSSAFSVPSAPFSEATPTKLLSLMSAIVTGTTSRTPQLSARLTLAVVPSRVATVTILSSMEAIEPRSRVGGVYGACAMAEPAVTNARNATTQTARRRVGVMDFLPGIGATLTWRLIACRLRLRDRLGATGLEIDALDLPFAQVKAGGLGQAR